MDYSLNHIGIYSIHKHVTIECAGLTMDCLRLRMLII
jgi:hypothetical protein